MYLNHLVTTSKNMDNEMHKGSPAMPKGPGENTELATCAHDHSTNLVGSQY
jgi:hypothetical protein